MNHDPEATEEPSLQARLLSVSLRLSILEFLHDDLSHRVDEAEEELDELWNVIDKIKRKQKIFERIVQRLQRDKF